MNNSLPPSSQPPAPPPSSSSSSPSSPPSSPSSSVPPIVSPPQHRPVARASEQVGPVAHGPVAHEPVQRPAARPPQRDSDAVLHSRPLILGLLFGVTAILGLPLLWYSPVFSPKEKFWWSIAIVFYTLALVLAAAAAWMVVYNAWTQGQLSL